MSCAQHFYVVCTTPFRACLHTTPGEMGSKLETREDQQYYADVASFAAASGELEEQTAPVAGWFWWSFNANSMGEHGRGERGGASRITCKRSAG